MDRTNYIAMLRESLSAAAQALQVAQRDPSRTVPPELVVPGVALGEDFTVEFTQIIGAEDAADRLKWNYIRPEDIMKLCAHFVARGAILHVFKFFRVTVKGKTADARYATVELYVNSTKAMKTVVYGTNAENSPTFLGVTSSADYLERTGQAKADNQRMSYSAVVDFGVYNTDLCYSAQFVHAFMCMALSVRMIEMNANGWKMMLSSTYLDDNAACIGAVTAEAKMMRFAFSPQRSVAEIQNAHVIDGPPIVTQVVFDEILKKFSPDGPKQRIDKKTGKGVSYDPTKNQLREWLKIQAFITDGKYSGAMIRYNKGGSMVMLPMGAPDGHKLFNEKGPMNWRVSLNIIYNIALKKGQTLAVCNGVKIIKAVASASMGSIDGPDNLEMEELSDDIGQPHAAGAAPANSGGASSSQGGRAPPTGADPAAAAADFGVAFE